jgi:Ser/Thr protein kinase RdoA (MazF antagonist)
VLHPSQAPAIAERYGLGANPRLTGPVASGRLGRVWKLTTDAGEYAVKAPFFEVSAADAERDTAYQDVVRRSGVPMPAVVRTVRGEVLADVDGSPVRVYEFVDVLEPDRQLDPVAVGELLARIHLAVVPTDEPVDRWYVEPVGAEAWSDLVRRLLAGGAPFAETLESRVPEVLAAEALLTAPTHTRVCHRDLWADNILRSADGGLMVLDRENSGAADPSHELGMVVFEFGCGDRARMRGLYTAYRAAGGPGRLRHPGDLSMLIAATGHIAQEGCERWLAARTDAERADNAEWVREFLDDPVTPATVDGILAALT